MRSRWVAVAGEALVLCVALALGPLHATALWILIGTHAASNAALHLSAPHTDRALSVVLVGDVVLLTAMLHFSGGPTNPFAALYFAHVTFAAVLFGGRATAATWLVSMLGYAALFALADHAHGEAYRAHLYGMFAAFAITGGLLGFFVARLSRALRERESELRIAEQRAERASRVASLTTLAAGAAHELGSPLGTIGVIAGELARADLGEHAEDIQLIRDEVQRCRRILDSLSARSGDVVGEVPVAFPVEELWGEVRSRVPADRAERLRVSGDGSLLVPRLALAQALTTLVENAFDASDATSLVELDFKDGAFEVRDRGRGMDAPTLSRATEPFFTTKDGQAQDGQAPDGRAGATGMGLGLFLASEIASALGGTLELASSGQGTTARLVIPR